MLMVVFSVFRGVWVVNGWSNLIAPRVEDIRGTTYLFLPESWVFYQFISDNWIETALDTSLFYLGHYDSDGDGREEMYFYDWSSNPNLFYIFEADSNGTFQLVRDKAIYVDSAYGTRMMMYVPPTCYTGDADKDGLGDLICTPYPYDSVITGCELCPWIVMFEAVGDNRWEKKVLMGNAPNYVSPNMMDTDGDGKLEFAYDGGIVEVVGNDSLAVVSSAPDGYSLMVPDADGDGKPEIVFYWRSSSLFKVGIYEADSNNHWSRKVLMVPDTSSSIFSGFSNYGDIDRDGRPEILIGTFGKVKIYKAVGNDDYDLIGIVGGGSAEVGVSNVYDLDGDSLMEFAVSYYYSSGSGRTIGYEYEPLGVEEGSKEGVGVLWVGDGYVEVEGEGVLEIYDVVGRVIRKVKVNGKVRVDVKYLPKGVYFVKFGGATMKFIRR